jgi:NAD(P)-dependent dehydrogenase (short-subunit alcohol dehydrogenase family)
MSLQGKVAIVTGAARGLGRAYALRLARLGADVAIFDVDLAGAGKFGETLTAATVSQEVQALGRQSIEVQADLADRDAVNDAVGRVQDRFGRIDILINNAGGAITPPERSKPSVMTDEDIRRIFDVNLMSTIYCCQAVAPIMVAQKSGVIVNTSSTAARTVARGGSLSHYGSAKAAVTHYTRDLAAELGPSGIRVNAIAPGVMLTARVKSLAEQRGIGVASEANHVPLRRLGEVEDCAGVVEFLVTDLSRYVTGQCISVCGGASLTPA